MDAGRACLARSLAACTRSSACCAARSADSRAAPVAFFACTSVNSVLQRRAHMSRGERNLCALCMHPPLCASKTSSAVIKAVVCKAKLFTMWHFENWNAAYTEAIGTY